MKITRQTRLFFDASVLVAGSHSSTGASSLILQACQVGGFRACASIPVLKEAETNIRADLPHATLLRYYSLLAEISWEIGPVPSRKAVEAYHGVVAAKDAHVIASAVACPAEFLLTLDKKHLLNEAVGRAGLQLIIVSPGEFIRNYYHLHDEYPAALPRTRDKKHG